MPSVFRPSDRARTEKPKSAEEIGFHAPPTLESSRSGFPVAAAARKMSQRVRTWLLIFSPGFFRVSAGRFCQRDVILSSDGGRSAADDGAGPGGVSRDLGAG